jgi:flavodoxin I
MPQIIYDTISGNTRKLAEAMAVELGLKAENAKAATIGKGNGVLFLGSGCYGGKPGKNIMKLIEAGDFKGRKVALFSTSGGGLGMELKVMAEALKAKGADVPGSYTCAGKVLPALFLYQRGHPDAAEIESARKFAREMAGKP